LNVTSSSLITIDVISPLPFATTLEHGCPSCDFVSIVLNPQVVTPFDVAIPLFPSSVQPSSNANIHVDFLVIFSNNVVVLSDLLDMESDLDLLHVCPPQKLKKSYHYTMKFQLEWVAKLFWVENV
jgi:hypothetical protein